MTDYTSSTLGLLPLPDWAKKRLESLKGHQKEDLVDEPFAGEVAAVYRRARAEVVEWQTAAGLDAVGGGQLGWDDVLAHPLVVAEGVDAAGIVRYYDNNNFYREPVVRRPLEATGRLADDLASVPALPDEASLQAVVPGPYTLADLAVDEHYGTDDRFEAAVADLLAEEVAAFPDAVDRLTVLEPSLGVGDPRLNADRTAALFDPVAGATGATTTVHTYWGAPQASVYRGLLDSDVDGVGLDLVTAAAESRNLVADHGAPGWLSLGVVAGQQTAVASAGDLRDRVAAFLADTDADPDVVDVTPNTELFYLPTSVVTRKLDRLGDVVREVVEA